MKKYSKFGIISDTHDCSIKIIKMIIHELKERNVDIILHCGDIIPEHIDPVLFDGIPVICALTDEQVDNKEIDEKIKLVENNSTPWIFTYPEKRILDINGTSMYIGHKRSFELLIDSVDHLLDKCRTIRKNHNNLRYLFSGHTHHAIFMGNGLVYFINPGAIVEPIGCAQGHEFATVDITNKEFIFSRIPKFKSTLPDHKIAVISDSFLVAKKRPDFWEKLNENFQNSGIDAIIHCGNIHTSDIGRPELNNYQIFYNPPEAQRHGLKPQNWHIIDHQNPILEIAEHKFYVDLLLGTDILDQSEGQMQRYITKLRKQHPDINYILCGNTKDPFLEELPDLIILNPGRLDRDNPKFATISLPIQEISFQHLKCKC